MKLDRKRVETLTSMNDEKFWNTVKFFASANSIDVSKKRVTPRDIQSMKRMLSSLTDPDLARIGELISIYKYGR